MKIIWPDKFKVKAEKIGEDRWKMNYIERFEQAPQAVVNDTAKMLKNINKLFASDELKVRVLKGGISVSVKGSREEIFNYLTGEFLPQSTLGKKTFAEVFIGLGVAAGLMKPDPDLLKRLEQVKTSLANLPQPGITGEEKVEKDISLSRSRSEIFCGDEK